MVSGIRFFACSGAMGLFGDKGQKSIDQVYDERATALLDGGTPLIEIENFAIGIGQSPNRIGFFGSAGAPNSAVIVGQYQDTTYRTNDQGAEFGEMINAKFVGGTVVDLSGTLTDGPMFGSSFDVADVPNTSGTLLCRFVEPNGTLVITQQATFRAVDFGAPGPAAGDPTGSASGVPDLTDLADGITVQAAQLADTDGDAGDSAWSEISSGGAALSLADQSAEANIHDFHLLISATPLAAGRKVDFGYVLQLEFL